VKLPAKIKIGARDIRVFEVEHLSDDEDRWGDYSARAGAIRIDASIPDDMKEETLLHEVCEVISDIYALGLTEQQVCTISAVLLAIVRDNPGLWRGGDWNGK
jgi:hypothetical protein